MAQPALWFDGAGFDSWHCYTTFVCCEIIQWVRTKGRLQTNIWIVISVTGPASPAFVSIVPATYKVYSVHQWLQYFKLYKWRRWESFGENFCSKHWWIFTQTSDRTCLLNGYVCFSSFQIVFYEGQDFQGKSYDCKGDSADLDGFIHRCNSVKVQGGWWVLYERSNFSGFQYIIGPGEYKGYSQWMGFNDCVRSCKIIKNVSLQKTWRCKNISYTQLNTLLLPFSVQGSIQDETVWSPKL